MEIRSLLELMVQKDASDLHLKIGSPPGLRIHGELEPAVGIAPLTPDDARSLVEQLMTTDGQRNTFKTSFEADFSYSVPGLARFRVNLFHQRSHPGAVLRKIPYEIPPLESLQMSTVVRDLCHKPRGLVLVTGPTGSGKSTTLAAMIDHVNRNERGHILTLEDPIEFIHSDKNCFVNQREIGADSKSFGAALRSALREDPDVILVGEMRDLETIGLAITAAETGHLVFGTLHTTSAIQTVDRIVDVFPHDAQAQIRLQLSVVLQGVISQTLMPKLGGGRCCAQEIMVATDAVRSLVREGKTSQLSNVLQTGTQYGMQTLEMHLAKLVQIGFISPDEACSKANSPQTVMSLIKNQANNVVVTAAPTASAEKPSASASSGEKPAAPHGPGAPVAPVAVPVGAGAGAGSKQTVRSTMGSDDFETFRKQRMGTQ
jgi:twitching motility protein PilT